MSATTQPPARTAATLATAWNVSSYARRALAAETGSHDESAQRARWTELAAAPWPRARLDAEADALLAGPAAGAAALAGALRQLRRRVLLALIARDATGLADLDEVTGTMTALAEIAVERALAFHAPDLAAMHGVPLGADGQPQDLLVVGMGKLGGGELNVSSDVDLIFVYEQDGATAPDPRWLPGTRSLSNQEFFERLGRRLIGALSDVTADGFVFRVDMRLRPNGDAGPMAGSCDMLEQYLMVQGREWERFAWLKGRVVSAPVFTTPAQFAAQRAALDAVVRPFVYRKYLDYGAIGRLAELHATIRAETGRRAAVRLDDAARGQVNVKLGRGGIREIEFLAQTWQVMRGGREPRLTGRSTLATLAVLAELGVLPAARAEQLAREYEFLRRVEHALQYVDDAQTHRVPADGAARDAVAQLLGLADGTALLAALARTQDDVAAAFDATFHDPARHDDHAPMPAPWRSAGQDGALDPLVVHLQALGFAEPAASAARIDGLMRGRRVQAMREQTRLRVERLVALAARAAVDAARATGAGHDIGADALLARLLQLLDVIAGRSTYVELLHQYPQAFQRVLRLLAASSWATDYLVRHPILLDELLDERLAAEPAPDWAAWRTEVQAQLAPHGDDAERQMSLLRDAHHAQVFRLLVADLEGRLSIERLADHLSALADATLEIALARSWALLPRRHRDHPRFAIVGYGKLGGKELGYASDLDLIYLYDDPDPDAAEVYAQLVRRLMTWLTAQTPSGVLFDIDLRLRPNGNAGLMVSSFDAFAAYQRNEDGHGAWLWETQALTRARHCAGDAELGARFEAERSTLLRQARDPATLRAEVLKMRRRMHDGHPNRSDLFDIKHDAGGMVDIEFIVQTAVLQHAHAHAELVRNLGNIALLHMAGAAGLIDATQATQVADAYRRFRAIQHRLRLNGAQAARVPATEVAAESAAVRALWMAVLGEMA